MKLRTLQILLFAAAVVALSGCFPMSSNVQVDRPMPDPAIAINPSIQPTEKIAAMATQTSPPEAAATLPPTLTPIREQLTPTPITLAGMGVATQSFTDTYAGFTFDYPTNWVLNALDPSIAQNSVGYTHSVRSPWPTVGPKQQEGFPPGTSGIDVTVLNEGTRTLEQAVAERREAFKTDEFPPTILSEEEWVLPSGLKAVVFMLDTRMGPVANLVTVINGLPVLVTGMGELTLYEPIARSLRPAE